MGIFTKNYGAIQVDSSIKQRLENKNPKGSVISIRPYQENDSIKGSKELLRTLYNTFDDKFAKFFNTSQISTFEIWYTDGKIQFFYYIEDDDTRERFLKQIGAFFENSEATVVHNRSFPEIEEGEWIAGGRFNLKKHYFEPIRYPGGTKDMEFDPYRSITNDITAKEETRMIIQVVMKPVVKEWDSTYTKDVGEHGEKIRDDDKITILENFKWKKYEVSQPEAIRKAAKDIQEQKGKPAFYVNLRILAIAPTKKQAIEQCKSVGRIYEQTHEESTRQTLVPIPEETSGIPQLINDINLRRGRKMNLPRNPISIAARKISRYIRGSYETMIMTQPELTGLAHIPDKSIKNSKVDWNRLSVDGTIPPDAPEFEDFHGGESDDQRDPEEYKHNKTTEDTEETDFESDWNKEPSEVEKLIEDSLDRPMDEFVE